MDVSLTELLRIRLTQPDNGVGGPITPSSIQSNTASTPHMLHRLFAYFFSETAMYIYTAKNPRNLLFLCSNEILIS